MPLAFNASFVPYDKADKVPVGTEGWRARSPRSTMVLYDLKTFTPIMALIFRVPNDESVLTALYPLEGKARPKFASNETDLYCRAVMTQQKHEIEFRVVNLLNQGSLHFQLGELNEINVVGPRETVIIDTDQKTKHTIVIQNYIDKVTGQTVAAKDVEHKKDHPRIVLPFHVCPEQGYGHLFENTEWRSASLIFLQKKPEAMVRNLFDFEERRRANLADSRQTYGDHHADPNTRTFWGNNTFGAAPAAPAGRGPHPIGSDHTFGVQPASSSQNHKEMMPNDDFSFAHESYRGPSVVSPCGFPASQTYGMSAAASSVANPYGTLSAPQKRSVSGHEDDEGARGPPRGKSKGPAPKGKGPLEVVMTQGKAKSVESRQCDLQFCYKYMIDSIHIWFAVYPELTIPPLFETDVEEEVWVHNHEPGIKLSRVKHSQPDECCVCMVEDVSVVLLECGHAACCKTCASSPMIKDCPLCRKPKTMVVPILFPTDEEAFPVSQDAMDCSIAVES